MSNEGIDPLRVISVLRREGGEHKRKVTNYLKKLRELSEEEQLTPSFCKTNKRNRISNKRSKRI